MKRVLTITLLSLFLISSFAISFQPIVPTASAQTRTTVRYRRHKRSFWQKHRDKLTVAGTAATGAGVGAIAGGGKGAAIGTAVGAGSGALYTYKLRKRHRRVRRY